MKKNVNVLGRTFNIKYRRMLKDPDKEILPENMMGLLDGELGTIFIKKGMDKDTRKMTIIHEILHAVFTELENADLVEETDIKTEEALVVAMAKTLVYNKLIKGC